MNAESQNYFYYGFPLTHNDFTEDYSEHYKYSLIIPSPQH